MMRAGERSGEAEFRCGGSLPPKFNWARSAMRAAIISLVALIGAEILVISIYYFIEPEALVGNSIVTAIVTVVIAFPISFHLSVQRFKLEHLLVQLSVYSKYDPLSGLYNRATFETASERVLTRAGRDAGRVAVLFIDADEFKDLNDSYGHQLGDEVIKTIGKAICAGINRSDFAGRVGGEEFCVLLCDNSAEMAEAIAQHIADAVTVRTRQLPIDREVTVSIGVAIHRRGEDLQAMLARADKALYRAKADGRNRIAMCRQPELPGGSDNRSTKPAYSHSMVPGGLEVIS